MNVCFLVHSGTNSRSTLLDLRAGFERAGHRVSDWDTGAQVQEIARNPLGAQRLVSEYTAAFERFLREGAIDMCLGMWGNGAMAFMCDLGPGGVVRSVFDRTRVPLVCYWLDAPFWAHDGKTPDLLMTPAGSVLRSERLVHIINNPGTAMEMTRVLGLRNVLPLHYGVNPDTFRPDPGAHREFDIMFSYGPGDPAPTPTMLAELETREPDTRRIRLEQADGIASLLGAQVDRWPAQLRDGAVQLLRVLVALQIERRDTPMLLRLDGVRASCPHLRECIEHLLSDLALWSVIAATLRQIENWERAFTYSFLSRHFACATFGMGDPGPWECRGTHLGPVEWEQQGAMYSRARLGLNVMRWQDDVGLNVKPFEITASGAALLSSRRGGLHDLWRDEAECYSFTSPAHARQIAARAIESPDIMAAVASAGRERTLANYTWAHVARRISERVQVLGSLGAG